MIDIERLKGQHKDIFDSVRIIESYISNNNFKDDLDELAEEINVLAGKMKIHLSIEDAFLYPSLIKSGSQKARQSIMDLSGEMTFLNSFIVGYKNKYNTRDKILKDIDGFIRDSNEVFEILRARISVEEKDIYGEAIWIKK